MQANRGEQPLAPEILGDAELIDSYYEESKLDNVLNAYAKREISDDEAGQAVKVFGNRVGRLAYTSETDIAIEVVREGFERLSACMDEILHERLGETPRLRDRLFKFGADQPRPQYIRRMDEKYWDKQFLDDYRKGTALYQPSEHPNEDEFSTYAGSAMYGFVYAPFTFGV